VTKIRWTEQAVADLRSIREFIERDSPRYGRLVAERLYQATERLEQFPRSGRVVREVGRDDLRELIVGDYRIVYRLEPDAVVLLMVFRGSRLFPIHVVEP
jgi:addiction module RelE/StbE family toxin